MNRYSIEILSDTAPHLKLGEHLAGGVVVAISDNEPDMVGVSWLSDKTGLSKSTIINKLAPIAQGTQGKKIYPRLSALSLLKGDEIKRGRKRKN